MNNACTENESVTNMSQAIEKSQPREAGRQLTQEPWLASQGVANFPVKQWVTIERLQARDDRVKCIVDRSLWLVAGGWS